MRERLNTLQSEQEILKELQMQLEILTAQLEKEKNENKIIRKSYLQIMNKRNEIELQLLETQDRCGKLIMETNHLVDVKTPLIQEKTEHIRQQHMNSDHTFYSAHLTDIIIRQQVMEGKIQNYRRYRRKREALLNQLTLDRNKHCDAAEELIQQTEKMKEEIQELECIEGKQNEEISDISIQIRALLNKVSVLFDF
jgi:chromosome segregation ATPase